MNYLSVGFASNECGRLLSFWLTYSKVSNHNQGEFGIFPFSNNMAHPILIRSNIFSLMRYPKSKWWNSVWSVHEPSLVGGWALPLWKMMEFVSWGFELPNIWTNMFQTTNQIMYGDVLFSWAFNFFNQLILSKTGSATATTNGIWLDMRIWYYLGKL